MKGPYDDIIRLPHPDPKRHPRMSMADRAAQFAPFAALTGFGDVIDGTADRINTDVPADGGGDDSFDDGW